MVAEVEIVKVFLLVMVRISGLILTAPVLGSNNFPITGKIGLIGLTAFLVTPTLPVLAEPLPADTLEFGIMAISELMIGIVIGLVMTLVFSAIQVGGQLMDMQAGFGMMNVFNPAFETQFPIFGFFYFILAVLFLLISNLHHMMILGLVSTFDRIPLGGLNADIGLIGHVSTWGNLMFYDGLLIAAPVAAAMMLAYMSMGIMGRLVPQIHLFVVGFPLTIAISLLLVALTVNIYLVYLETLFYKMFQNVDTLVQGLG